MLGSTLSSTMMCPLSVVKIHMQAAKTKVPVVQAVRNIWRANGFSGFYRGLGSTVAVHVPYSTLYLGYYGLLRAALPTPNSSLTAACQTMLAGGASSIATWTLLQPLDTVRTHVQASASLSSPHKSWKAQFRTLVKTHGVKSLWRGYVPVAVRSLPSSGGSMLAYEAARSCLAK